MTQRYTRSTAAVLAYCPTCNRKTMHRVDDRRLGPCLEHGARELTRKQEKERERERLENEERQGSLFITLERDRLVRSTALVIRLLPRC